MLEYVLAIPCILAALAAVYVVERLIAGLTSAPDKVSSWLRTILGGCALVGGIAFSSSSAASVSVGRDWIQSLGSLPLAAGSKFSATFAVEHKGAFWVVLVDEGYYYRLFAPLARNEGRVAETPWHEMSVPWAITASAGPVASGTGKTIPRDGAYTEELDPYFVSFGSFEALPGRQYRLALRVAKSIPELADKDAVVQIRADSYVFKRALHRAGWLRLLADGLIGTGIVLLVLALVARLRS